MRLDLTLVALKGQCQRHSDFEGLYLVMKQLGHAMLLNIHRKSHMQSPAAPSHWHWATLKGQSQVHSDIEGLYVLNKPG